MRLRIVAPVSALSRRTRLYKLATFVRARYPPWRVHHIGWERVAGEAEEIYLGNEIEKTILIRGGGYGGVRTRAMYLLWMVRVFLYSLRFGKGEIVWALGFESAFPAMLAASVRGFSVIFDDADRFSLLFPMPRWLRSLVGRLEAVTSRHVVQHVVPGLERYDFKSDRLRVLRNMPSERDVQAAREMYRAREWPKDKLVINVNGWLGAGRGMDAALKVAQTFLGRGVSLILAGKLDCADAKTLAAMENVYYLGQISSQEALASYFASDMVLTYYKPDTRINRLAESNKWGDAIKTGTAVIVNSEVETASYLRGSGAAISVPYADHDALLQAIAEMLDEPERLAVCRQAAQALASRCGFFEDQLDDLFSILIGASHEKAKQA